jgi:CCR4-NOT transcription complex subunit 1
LESDRAITQTNERTLIKQLGSWLGLLTFAKNKPVLAKDMDLKQLIADAYTRGRMIAVLPFVEKVLSGCKDTKVCLGEERAVTVAAVQLLFVDMFPLLQRVLIV